MVVDATVGMREVVTVEEYDSALTRFEVPWWDTLSPREKALEAEHIESVREHTADNTTCVGLHRHLAELLNGALSVDEPVEELALGSSTTQTDPSDTSLGSEITRLPVTSYSAEDGVLTTRTFVGTKTANGSTIREVGLYAGGKLCNHSILASEIVKDNSTETTITVRLSFAAQ